jgi:F-type H+-transporting ATPase subunit delta
VGIRYFLLVNNLLIFLEYRRGLRVAEEAIGVSGLAGRYATALFDLAKEKGEIDGTEDDLIVLESMLDSSGDLNRLIRSPVIARDEQGRAMAAVVEKIGLGDLTKKFIGLLARNRRLFVLRRIIRSFVELSATGRGEVTAEVASAMSLSELQLSAIADQLSRAVGKNVVVRSRVDGNLLGGLVVKIGSRMVDNSLRSKLQRMKLVMKGVG